MIINYDFQFDHKTKVIFGAEKINLIGAITKDFGKRALIVSDKGITNSGIADKVTEKLRDREINYVIYDNVVSNPTDKNCEEAAEIAKSFSADVIIGVGGGSAMDTAKAANVLITQGGTCEEHAVNRCFEKPLLPLICVPTTSGTGSEVTFEAVITIGRLARKASISDGSKLAPNVAVMDPALTVSVPPLVTASTGMDALTHAIEAYTCKYAQPISDGLACYAMEMISKSIKDATFDGNDISARTNMMIGSLMAGMAFTNSFLGAVHSISERLGGFYNIPHGVANAIFLPYVIEFNMNADWEKHAAVAKCLGIDTAQLSDEKSAKKGVQKLFELNKILGIPKFSEFDKVKPNDFPAIAELCNTHPCGFKANPKKITIEDYVNILTKAYEAI
jgi:alcohol dehydrogenase